MIDGHAVSFRGYVRATEGLDVIWLLSPAAEAALLAAPRDADARWISDEVDPATRLEKRVPVTEAYVNSSGLMMLVTNHGFLDLFDYVPGCPGASVQAPCLRG